MHWVPVELEVIDMNAEIGAYQGDPGGIVEQEIVDEPTAEIELGPAPGFVAVSPAPSCA